MHKLTGAVVLAVVMVLVSPSSSAAQMTNAPVHTGEAEGAWYGWQLLIGDALSLAGGLAIGHLGGGSGDLRFADVTASTWGLGMLSSTAIHGAHNPGIHGLVGARARVVAAPVGSLLGLAVGCIATSADSHCASKGARFGFVGGLAVAAVVDAVVFGYERHDEGTTGGWYGWQPLVIDGALLGAGIYTVARADDLNRSQTGVGLAALPWVGGFLFAPWVHGFHGRWSTALLSFGIRSLGVGFGALGGLIGHCAASGAEKGCTDTGAAYGLLGGALLAATIDAALMSYDDATEGAEGAQILPFVAPQQRGAVIGFSASL